MANLRHIKDYPEEYKRIYDSYEKFSKNAETVREFMGDEFVQILKQSHFSIPENLPIRVLSIGGGPGLKDIRLLHKLREIYPHNQLEVTLIEPCRDYIKAYTGLIEAEELLKGAISLTSICQTSQEYQEIQSNKSDEDTTSRFHFILMFEVLYYETNLSGSMSFYLNQLDDQGFILVAMNVRETSWNQMCREFSFFDEGWTAIGVEDVEDVLINLPCRYQRFVRKIGYQLDFVFEKENEDADNVLSHWSHVVNFRQEATMEQIEFYENLVKKHSLYEDGHFIFTTDIGILVIRKTAQR